MKKIFTLMISLFALATAGWAQEVDGTFVFVDEAGNVVPDGTVITVSAINEEGQMVVPLKVKNVSGEKAAVSMYENIDAKPVAYDEEGRAVADWQTCAFGNCMNIAETGYSSKNIVPGEYDEGIQTEWLPETGKYASWTATLQIHVFNITTKSVFGRLTEQAGDEIIGYGPKVTVNFVYDAASAHISNTQAETAPVEYYNLRGQRTATSSKGLNIVKLANGKTIKQIVR